MRMVSLEGLATGYAELVLRGVWSQPGAEVRRALPLEQFLSKADLVEQMASGRVIRRQWLTDLLLTDLGRAAALGLRIEAVAQAQYLESPTGAAEPIARPSSQQVARNLGS